MEKLSEEVKGIVIAVYLWKSWKHGSRNGKRSWSESWRRVVVAALCVTGRR
jgi:hypothetical protein